MTYWVRLQLEFFRWLANTALAVGLWAHAHATRVLDKETSNDTQ